MDRQPNPRRSARQVRFWLMLSPTMLAALVLPGCGPADGGRDPSTDASGSVTTETEQSTTTFLTTTRPGTTATSLTTVGDEQLPVRAIAQVDAHLSWVDVASGATEVIVEYLFEAASAGGMALSPDHSHVYYGLGVEDYWFSCETVYGLVTMLDLASGATTTIGPGNPALSPDGGLLGYLTSDRCYPDPEEPQFFASYFDTLVIADAEGAEVARYSLGAEIGADGGESLINIVWFDRETILVTDAGWNHYLIPATEGGEIRAMETVELPALVFGAVVDKVALGAPFDEDRGHGPLQAVDLVSGETRLLKPATKGPYGMGVSAAGQLIVTATGEDGRRLVLVDLDLTTGEADRVMAVEQIYSIDW